MSNDVREICRLAGITEQAAVDNWITQRGYMDVHTVTVAKITRMALPPEAWQLYNDKPGAKRVANALSNAFAKLVNSGKSREEVRQAMDQLREKYAEYGADDTEPRYTLNALLTATFGSSEEDY